jgi:hypothetical protein
VNDKERGVGEREYERERNLRVTQWGTMGEVTTSTWSLVYRPTFISSKITQITGTKRLQTLKKEDAKVEGK